MSSQFFTQRFYLDTPSNRSTGRGGPNFVGPFKSFWVSATNNSSFDADLIINPVNNSDKRGIPLRLNQCQSFSDKPEAACIEFSASQPGVWIDITFAQNDNISVGSIIVENIGAVLINGGSSYSNDKYAVTNASTQLLPADSNRASSHIYNTTGEKFYVGTQAKINAADFYDTCIPVYPNSENGPAFIHDTPDALYCRKEAVGTIYPVILNKGK